MKKNKFTFKHMVLGLLILGILAFIFPLSASTADISENSGFEDGLTGWVTQGAVAAEETAIYTELYEWVVNPSERFMAELIPQETYDTENLGLANLARVLRLSEESKAYIGGLFPEITNYAYIYKDIALNAGERFTVSWNYVATDYAPFNDASFISLVNLDDPQKLPVVNGYVFEVGILGATVKGTGNYSTGDYGSTGWQTAEFRASYSGNYRLGFAVFNLNDSGLSPFLFVDDLQGTTLSNGSPFEPIEKDDTAPPPPETTSINYDSFIFTEAGSNDGTIGTTLNLTLTGDQFAGADGEAVPGVTFQNVPAGLTPILTKTSNVTATLSFTGKAVQHTSMDDVANFTVIIGDESFVNGNAEAIPGAMANYIEIRYTDPVYRSITTSRTGNGTISVSADNAEAGEMVTFSVTPDAGYFVREGSVKATHGTNVEITLTPTETGYSFAVPEANVQISAAFDPIPAATPVITTQPAAESTFTYGDVEGILTVGATVSDGGVITYQWYKGESAEDVTVTEGKKVGTGSTFSIPVDLNAGAHYYFSVAANLLANGQSSSKLSSVATVVVNKADAELSDIVQPGKMYDGTPLNPSASILKGEGTVEIMYSGGEIVGSSATPPSDAGTYTITAILPESANYNAASKTKEVTISKATQDAFRITNKPSALVYGAAFELGTEGGASSGELTWGAEGDVLLVDGTYTVTGMAGGTITATKAGDKNYLPATDTFTFTPGKATPAIGTVSASAIYVGDQLADALLTRTDTSIEGDLAWGVNASFDAQTSGSKVAEWTFTPTGNDAEKFVSLSGTTTLVTVNKRDILSITGPADITSKYYGTALGDLGLPSEVSVTAQGVNGTVTRTVSVTWSAYNSNTLAEQTLTGTQNLAGNAELTNTDSLTTSIKIVLQPLPVKDILDVTAKLKVGTANGTQLLKELVTEQFDGSVDLAATNADAWTGFPANYNMATTETQIVTVRVVFAPGSVETYRDVTIRFDVVNPLTLAYVVSEIPAVSAISIENAAAANVLAHINSKQQITATWPEDAIGTSSLVDNAPSYTELPSPYVETGKTYTFQQTYLGHVLTQTFVVNGVNLAAPELDLDYALETINTTAALEYRLGDGDWTPASVAMSFDAWLGETVSFRTAAVKYKLASDAVSVTFPTRDSAPESLFAVINEDLSIVTIANLEDGISYEYTVDGVVYADLPANGQIPVDGYVRLIGVRKKHVADTRIHSEAAIVDVNYTVTFYTGIDNVYKTEYLVEGELLTRPSNPVKLGFYFAGWYTGEYGSGDEVSFPHAVDNNLNAYARWIQLPQTDDGDAAVIVDGVTQSAGSMSTTKEQGRDVTKVTVDTKKLQNILDRSGDKPTVVVPVTTGSEVNAGILTGQMVKTMEDKDAKLVIQTNQASYSLPANEIRIDEVSAAFGEDVSLSDIFIDITISEPSSEMMEVVRNAANQEEFTLVVPAVEFTITGSYGDRSIAINNFSTFIERIIAIPDGVDPRKITTGVVVRPDGTTYHVPTKLTVIDGKYYAIIHSLTNSVYSVIWNPTEFADTANHWAKDAISDMGSRKIVSGVAEGVYDPNRDITRAEFAAIIVRALGLAPGTGRSPFADVPANAWYAGYVQTAAEHNLINGYGDTYRPFDKITREQAITIIARAMKLTQLDPGLSTSEAADLLSTAPDSGDVAEYAKASVAAGLRTGVIQGRNGNLIAAKDFITRAEVAVIVRRLLQKSELI